MSTPLPDLSDMRILLVDDEPDNRYLMAEVIDLAGAEVLQAENGQEALEMLQQAAPDIILLDIAMPVLDGWEFRRQLRSDPAMDHIPIIVCSALAMSEEKRRIQEAGFDAHISKPFKVDDLYEELAYWQSRLRDRNQSPD